MAKSEWQIALEPELLREVEKLGLNGYRALRTAQGVTELTEVLGMSENDALKVCGVRLQSAPKKRGPSRKCPTCNAMHKSGQTKCKDSFDPRTKFGVCPRCFIEIPATGSCGNCE